MTSAFEALLLAQVKTIRNDAQVIDSAWLTNHLMIAICKAALGSAIQASINGLGSSSTWKSSPHLSAIPQETFLSTSQLASDYKTQCLKVILKLSS